MIWDEILSAAFYESAICGHGGSLCTCTPILSLELSSRQLSKFGHITDSPRHIASARHPIPDVPVLYLVEPTSANLKAITTDLSRGLYSPAYVNFLSSIPRPLLEEFASQTAEAGTSESIAQVFDQYLNFVVSEPDLFSLGMRKDHTYWALNSARTADQQIENLIERIVSGLFSVVATMGMWPLL